jgi:hypothetical protein
VGRAQRLGQQTVAHVAAKCSGRSLCGDASALDEEARDFLHRTGALNELPLARPAAHTAECGVDRRQVRPAPHDHQDRTRERRGEGVDVDDVEARKGDALQQHLDIAAAASARAFFSKLVESLGVSAESSLLGLDPEFKRTMAVGRPLEFV